MEERESQIKSIKFRKKSQKIEVTPSFFISLPSAFSLLSRRIKISLSKTI
jgi:hypothetical protein